MNPFSANIPGCGIPDAVQNTTRDGIYGMTPISRSPSLL